MLTPTFLYAGRAVLTVSNNKGQHYTFKIKQGKSLSNRPAPFFVYLRTGEHYNYIGMILDHHIVATKASKMNVMSLPFRVFNWSIGVIRGKRKLPAGYKLQHEGTCGKCGRPLTNPESIETGIGPVCAGKL